MFVGGIFFNCTGGSFRIFFVKHGDVSAKMFYSGGPFHNFWKMRGLFLGKTECYLFIAK